MPIKIPVCQCLRPSHAPLDPAYRGGVRCAVCNGVYQITDSPHEFLQPDQKTLDAKIAQWKEEDMATRRICQCGAFEPGETVSEKTYCRNCGGYVFVEEKFVPPVLPKTAIELLEIRVDELEKKVAGLVVALAAARGKKG